MVASYRAELGPYLMLELVLPEDLFALLLFLYRRGNLLAKGRPISTTRSER